MIFTSYTYVAFLALAFIMHWLLPAAWRKWFLIGASYVFYCSWRWQYGFLLLGVTLFNWAWARYVLARRSHTGLLVAGIAVNVGALLYFKYTGFFLENVAAVTRLAGATWNPHVEILLPLGISFFTFQGVAYLFDVAAGEEPLGNLVDFMLFKSFWPQLIAGPIVRLDEMRKQITWPRTIAYPDLAEGVQRIVFGFFKKILADNIGAAIDPVFLAGHSPHALDCVVGTMGFGMQIFFDFSAYSDIAIGSARLFGFRLPENFNWPYVSRNPQEFWNRWHMSLSRWIRDYIFMPLSFASRNHPRLGPLWLIVAMALCGLWHGAAWTMVLWGIWHGLLLAANQSPLRRLFAPAGDQGGGQNVGLPRIIVGTALTWMLVQTGWLLFRAPSLHQALVMAHATLTLQGGLRPAIMRENSVLFIGATFAGLVLVHLLRRPIDAFLRVPAWPEPATAGTPITWANRLAALRPLVYVLMIVFVIIFDLEAQTFVYFQF